MKKNYIFTLLLTLFYAVSFAQVSLPHYEGFDYTVGADIAAEANWENFSGSDNPIDVVSGSLSYNGLQASTGNSINLVGGFQDDRILFNEVTSGEVYASFLLNVTDISSITDLTDGGYFALFGSTTNSFRSRLWVKPTAAATDSTVDFAYTAASSGSGFGATQNLNSVVLIVMSYNVENGEIKAWINPDTSSFGGTAPAASFTNTDGSPTTIDRFMLRQDSTGETPNMLFDELRIGTSWASVTPAGTVSNDPAITINAPSNNQVFDGSTTEVPVTLTVDNFTLSADDGNGNSDGSGDGYIVSKLEETGEADEFGNFFTTTPPPINVVAGRSYTATVELVDNAGNSLTPKVEASVSFSVELPCNIMLDNASITATCDASTSAVDTYSGSINFTGGTGTTYTITAKDSNDNNVGTIGGDNPSNVASGTITVTGIPEGTNVTLNILGGSGSSCDLTRTIFSPVCKAFPIYEPFDYTVGTDLIASSEWENVSDSSDEIQVVAATLANPYGSGMLADPQGNMINFAGAGSDTGILFNTQTSGKVFVSFIFSPTDLSAMTDTTDGGYFAILGESSTFNWRARLYLRQTAADNTRYELGISESGSATNFNTTESFLPGEETFVVMMYDIDTNEIYVWANPDPVNFEAASAPTSSNTLFHTSGSTASNLSRFILRQDSDGETPDMNFDELRIGTTWAQVTPKNATASIAENNISGFTAYPNPVKNGLFNLTTNSSSDKVVNIFNILGKQVLSQRVSGANTTVNVSTLNSGIYILKVTEDGKTATKKLVIE